MFYATNRVNASDGEQILGYQLFQIAKELGSNELLVLKTAYEQQLELKGANAETFASIISRHLGHSVVGLTQVAVRRLVEKNLLSGYALTDIGIKFCENIQRYHFDR
jgi:hypothetical protein